MSASTLGQVACEAAGECWERLGPVSRRWWDRIAFAVAGHLLVIGEWDEQAEVLEAFAAVEPGAVESGRARARAVTLREVAGQVRLARARSLPRGERAAGVNRKTSRV